MISQARRRNDRNITVQILDDDNHSKIELAGSQLLKLEPVQPGMLLSCVAGTLWLTQAGDPHDHVLQAGQSLLLAQPGVVLVQGVPWGKVLFQLPQSTGINYGFSLN